MIGLWGAIAFGGALGAMARHGVNVAAGHYFGASLPWGTFIVNILGSFLMGVMIAKFSQMEGISAEIRALCATGFLGAFTTFSAFSLDFVTLWERGELFYAFAYMAASVICSIAALFCALYIMRGFAA